MQNVPSGIFCKSTPYYIEKGEGSVHNKTTNSKYEGRRMWHSIWAIVTATALILGGMAIASYMVMSERISIGSANTMANITLFVATLVAMATQINKDGKLWRAGIYILGMIIVFLLAGIIFCDGLTAALWQRLFSIIVSASFFVIITSRKGKKRFRWKGYAG